MLMLSRSHEKDLPSVASSVGVYVSRCVVRSHEKDLSSITSSVPFCRVCLRCLGRLELLVFPFGRDASLKSTNHVLYLINLLRQEMLQHWRHVPANLYHHSLSLALPAVFPSARVGFLVAFFFDLIL